MIEAYVTGGGWILARGYGRWSQCPPIEAPDAAPVAAPPKSVFTRIPGRYGRFDQYTRLGCAGIALALEDAALSDGETKRPIGAVASSRYECLETDLNYYRTTIEEGGKQASPNLFSYTLPGIVLGESALSLGLTGPTLCVGDDGSPGRVALETALRFLQRPSLDAMLAGWIESPPEAEAAPEIQTDTPRGALFVVLERSRPSRGGKSAALRFADGKIETEQGRPIRSLMDLFNPGD